MSPCPCRAFQGHLPAIPAVRMVADAFEVDRLPISPSGSSSVICALEAVSVSPIRHCESAERALLFAGYPDCRPLGHDSAVPDARSEVAFPSMLALPAASLSVSAWFS